jgi:actin-related protein 2
MVGEEATKARAVLDLSYPVNEGLVKNFEDLGHVWNYGF